MNTEKLGQEPAFPTLEQDFVSGNSVWNTTAGMTKRQLIAKDILCAILSNSRDNYTELDNLIDVKVSLSITDEFLRQEAL